MIESTVDFPLLILLTGGVIVLNILIKSRLERAGLPSLIGYLALGFLIRTADMKFGFLSHGAREAFEFLAKIGLITLLFRIGLESDPKGLLRQLRRASIVGFAGIVTSGLTGFIAALYVLDLSFITSLIVGTALTATSVGISVGVWQEADCITSPNGQILVDVAEIDDIAAVILMALLFTIIPVIRGGAGPFVLPLLARTSALFFLKLVAFGAFCFLFSRLVEHRLTEFFRSIESPPDPMLMISGVGFIIAAMAGLIGFSLAIGAFFAGLVFSRDPQAVKMEGSFLPLYDLFSPFFFIGIGLSIELTGISTALGLGTVLLVAAIVGKITAGVPVLFAGGFTSAVLIGLSMVPRAEIAMVIMQRGLSLGQWAMPSQVFSSMVMVSAATCVFSPVVVRQLLRRWPQKGGGS
jgi:Kef-type K+ transport system membrane component KefB